LVGITARRRIWRPVDGQLSKEKSQGDYAVDGLLSGAVAGVAGAFYLIAAGVLVGDSPAVVLGRFDPQMQGGAITGGVSHLAVSAVYGAAFAVLFGLLSRLRPRLASIRWPFTLLFGLVLLALAEALFAAGIDSALAEVPFIHFGLFHLIYGATLDLALKQIQAAE
jgi:hypothetical protein